MRATYLLAGAALVLCGCPPNAFHQLTLEAFPVGAGTVRAVPEQTTYFAGTEITITASPAPGYSFSGWRGRGINATLPQATLAIFEDTRITAIFQRDGEPEPGVLLDPGFELGPDSPAWEQQSLNFDRVICNVALCGDRPPGPFSGEHWVFFGGTPDGSAETASIGQLITLPDVTPITLRFQLAIPAADAVLDLDVFFGPTRIASFSGAQQPDFADYREVVLDLTRFAGEQDALEFRYTNAPTLQGEAAVYLDALVLHAGDAEN